MIYPGKTLFDTNHKRVQAHGGGLFYENGIYYFYGENKEYTTGKNKIWTYGIKYYSSEDLSEWKDEGFLIEPDLGNKKSYLYPSHCLDRPHIVKNQRTGKYICYLKFSNPKTEAFFLVLEADEFKGPYRIVKNEFRPFGLLVGDFDIYINQKQDAYLYFSNRKDGIVACKLSDDYLNVVGDYRRYYEGLDFPFSREGVALFEYQNTLYMITSGRTGYIPNQSRLAKLDSPLGELTELGDLCVGDETNTTFHSQVASVFIDPKTGAYIALADRWIPKLVFTPKKSERMIRAAASTNNRKYKANLLELASLGFRPFNCKKVNTSIADYVWLPINFELGRPCLQWLEKWSVDTL